MTLSNLLANLGMVGDWDLGHPFAPENCLRKLWDISKLSHLVDTPISAIMLAIKNTSRLTMTILGCGKVF